MGSALNSSRFNPEMLVLARESRGWTQTALAENVEVTQAQISRIEHGFREPGSDLIEKFSEVLRYRPSFFSRDEEVYGVPESYTRRRQALSATDYRKIVAELNIHRFAVTRLLMAAEVEALYPLPALDISDYGDSPDEVARAVRSAWNLPPGPVRNLARSIEAAGIMLIPCDFETDHLDAVGQRIPGRPPMIFYNRRLPGDRLRFTLAHELGHLVMHDVPYPQMEAEANRFAAEFLMPSRDIRPQLRPPIALADLAALKPVWRCSMAAIMARARDLDVISPGRYKSLRIEYTKRGYRKQEPLAVAVDQEEPRNLPDLIAYHSTELGYSADEMAALFDLRDLSEMQQKYGQGGHRLRLVAM